MNDPYRVLGISRDAGADEVKKAYRKLSRIYHPDANVNNPNKEQAEEKFKEVQEAYEQIMYEREHGEGTYGGGRSGYGQSGYGYGGYQQSYRSTGNTSYEGDSPQMRQAIQYINMGLYSEALNILNSMTDRSARWYFVHAHANYGIRNIIDATSDARRAVALEPGNPEYVNFLNQLEQGAGWYSNQGATYTRSGSTAKWCLECLAINLLCNGCGYLSCCFGGPR